jgi:hypothetical protein
MIPGHAAPAICRAGCASVCVSSTSSASSTSTPPRPVNVTVTDRSGDRPTARIAS